MPSVNQVFRIDCLDITNRVLPVYIFMLAFELPKKDLLKNYLAQLLIDYGMGCYEAALSSQSRYGSYENWCATAKSSRHN